MTATRLDRLLASRGLVPAAALASLGLGLAFIFIWAPHPWGWYGIDQYHPLAVDLSRGLPFATLDVPWGYAYFLAGFYRAFGPSPLPPLLAQVALNALIPVLVYAFAVHEFGTRVAAVASLLVALLSFNTVYASTESSDSVCTVLFMLMVCAFAQGRRANRWGWFAGTGLLLGLAAQFRPNLLILPVALAAFHVLAAAVSWRRLWHAALIVIAAALMLTPWTWRNYRLTDEFLPTSSHGGVQLWYGTLQAGPYLQSRASNPRSIFETPAFDYTSVQQPVMVNVFMNCAPGTPELVELVYQTEADRTPHRIALRPTGDGHYSGAIPALGRETRIDYYVETRWLPAVAPGPARTPAESADDSLVYFVSTDHLGDLDVDDRLLDVFDVTRVLRHLAWQEAPVRASDKLDLDRNGQLDEADLRGNLKIMLRPMDRGGPPVDRLRETVLTAESARAVFTDGSELVVPRHWNGSITGLDVGPGAAAELLSARHRFTEPDPPLRSPLSVLCLGPGEIAINREFYRAQMHELRRYTALAVDNIRQDPSAYAWSVLYRAVRLFVIQGSDDPGTAHQFPNSGVMYLTGAAVSAAYLLLAAIGAWIGWRRGRGVALPLLLVAYIPATIAFVLTNMRYTVTVQPLLLIFVAVAIVSALERVSLLTARREA